MNTTTHPTRFQHEQRPSQKAKGALACGLLAALLLAFFGARAVRSRSAGHSEAAALRAATHPTRAVTSRLSPPLGSLRAHGVALRIVEAARAQLGDVYDPSYVKLGYPNGDVAAGRGACTDVVVRALRGAGYDLQALVHRDMKAHRAAYPRRRGARLDANIDHRRVPNLMRFLARSGTTLSRDGAARAQWRPGDIVCWRLPSGLDHIGIVSDRRNARGVPLAIHNLSACAEEDVLAAWTVQGHFRFPR